MLIQGNLKRKFVEVGALIDSNRVKIDSNNEPIKFEHPPCPELKS